MKRKIYSTHLSASARLSIVFHLVWTASAITTVIVILFLVYNNTINSYSSKANPGKEGNQTINNPNVILNEDATLTSNVKVGNTFINVGGPTLNSNSRFVSNLSVGNSSIQHDYSWIDHSPLPGANDYRLVQHDYDSKAESFNIIYFSNKNSDENGK